MKSIVLILSAVSITIFSFTSIDYGHAPDSKILIGKWVLDMTPQNTSDNNFAMMEITEVNGKTMKGTFYREGVKLKSGRLNTQTGTIYGALISYDNSGEYNTSFYYKDGKLYGSTHAIERDFLAVWVGTKEN